MSSNNPSDMFELYEVNNLSASAEPEAQMPEEFAFQNSVIRAIKQSFTTVGKDSIERLAKENPREYWVIMFKAMELDLKVGDTNQRLKDLEAAYEQLADPHGINEYLWPGEHTLEGAQKVAAEVQRVTELRRQGVKI